MLTNRQLFFQHIAQTSPQPMALEIVRAEGCYIFAADGKEYLDLISGISVSNLGHRHPKVVEAIQSQLDKYLHLMVYGEYIQSPQTQLAQLLTQHLPDNLSSVYFVNSGSEAVEGAMKLAKRFTGRTEIISFKNAYHGSTHGALSIMGNEYFKQTFRPLLPDVKQLEFNDLSGIEQISNKTACVVVEPIQGEAGVKEADINFLKQLKARCSDKQCLLVFDEIQTGFGRTGKMFAFEHYDVVPDILLLAKGMGGGMPIGCFVSSKEIMQTLTTQPVLGHITTFGGHPVSCAASLACLQTLENETIIEQVAPKAQLFDKLLQHRLFKAKRIKGLMIAIEFENAAINFKIIEKCIKKGLIVDWFLFNDKSMRIAPPLIITEAQIEKACQIILESANEISA